MERSNIQLLSKSNLVAVGFVSLLAIALLMAWTLGWPKKPILYYGTVFVGSGLFILMGVVRSRAMTLLHMLALIIAGTLTYLNFNEAMSVQKQMTFQWPPVLIGLFLIFYFIHLRPTRLLAA